MKTWIRRTLIGLFGATALLGTFAAFSHHAHHGRYGWHAMTEEDAARLKERAVRRIGERLDLDETQKAKLGALADQLREQRNALVAGSADPRAEIDALIAGPTFDRTRAQALVQAKTQAVQTKSPDVIDALANFYDSLRPDQQAKVREFVQRRRHGWRS